MTKKSAVLLLILASVFWSMNGLFIRNVDGLSQIEITFGRLFIAFLPMLFWSMQTQKNRLLFKESLKNWKVLIILGFLMGLGFLANTFAFQMTHLVSAQTLSSLGMFFAVMFAPIFLQERTSYKDLIGMILTLIGVVLVLGIDKSTLSREFFWGDLIAFSASVVFGLYAVLARKFSSPYPFFITMTWIFGGGSLILLLAKITTETNTLLSFLSISGNSFLNLLGIGLLGTFAGHTILNTSVKHIRAEKALTLALLAAPMAFFIGLFFFEEILTPTAIFGLILSIVGVAIVTQHKKTHA